MKRFILKYGLLSGIISSGLMIASLPLEDRIGSSYILGYTVLVASFLLVYFGVRSYRERVGAGAITFGRAFAVGISITLISCIFYVVTWEITYFNFMPDFMDKYSAHEVQKIKASGASPAKIQAQLASIEKTRQMYNNVLYNSAITFMEPFPVGLIITLVSAAVLRRKALAEPTPDRAVMTT